MDSRMCALNNVTRAQYPNNFVTHYGSMYFDADLETLSRSQPTDSSKDNALPNPSSSLSSPRQEDCNELREAGHNVSGIYTIFPSGFDNGLQVYCDMDSGGGGWIVIQRRQDGSEDFFRNWTEYKVGFGSMSHEFWLGNDNLRTLTDGSESPWRLMVNLEGEQNKTAFAEYGRFKISGDNFTLHIDSYSVNSTAGDSLHRSHDGKMFTTKDRDNDWKTDGNCAASTAGAWWYKSCYASNLNGLFKTKNMAKGLRWSSWNDNIPVKKCSMKIRTHS